MTKQYLNFLKLHKNILLDYKVTLQSNAVSHWLGANLESTLLLDRDGKPLK